MFKKKLRKKYDLIRRNWIQNNNIQYQEQVRQILIKLVSKIKSNFPLKIAIYYPLDFELPILDLIYFQNWWPETKFYLPRISQDPKIKLLNFLCYAKNNQIQCELAVNRFGILEPIETANNQPIDYSDLDYMIIPMLAFTKQKLRLGYGGGYYDATLRARVNKPESIGIALACQEAECLPDDPWDLRLDCIITESYVI